MVAEAAAREMQDREGDYQDDRQRARHLHPPRCLVDLFVASRLAHALKFTIHSVSIKVTVS